MSQAIQVFVEERFREAVDKPWIKKMARQVLKAEGVSQPYEVSLVFTDSEAVQQLNREYRGVNEPTDVLAFHMLTREEDVNSFALPPDGVARLGEVVISYPRAVEQAGEQRHPVERELALLVIHGMLHLLGYDHEGTEDERKMRAREEELLNTYLPQ
jgi:probable rRNA maturation factor